MKVVQTNRGLIPRDQLTVSVSLFEDENALRVVTIWRVTEEGPDAPHVKMDCQVIFLATPEVQARFASMNGNDVTVGLSGQPAAADQARLG